MSRMIAVASAIMPPHLIDTDKISAVDWHTFPFGVRLEFNNGNWDIITHESANGLIELGAIPAP